jgi:glycosyltransferase involved in cell wall biosynthesis
MEENKPLISYVIPVYNVPTELLRECIDSILALSLRPFEREIIVIDDGSKVSPLNGLDSLADEFIYIRQKNSGVSMARNLGLRMASGTFVQFVDGDDLLLQSPYEHVLDLLRYHPSDVVMFDFTKTTEPDTLLYDDTEPMSGAELMRQENIHGSVWGYAFRNSILGSLRFTPGVAYGEDEEFTPQLLLRAESVVTTTAKAYYYRPRSTSAIGADDMRHRLRRLNDSKNVLLRLQHTADRMPAADRVALQRRTAQLTMDYIYNVIILTRNSHYLDRRLKELRQAGLFPLPDRDYTKKYRWFRRMSNSRAGLFILMKTLPLLNRER